MSGSPADGASNPRPMILAGVGVALVIGLAVGLLGDGGGSAGVAAPDRPQDNPVTTRESAAGPSEEVTTQGSVEVTAKLLPVRGLEEWGYDFPPNDLYDYAYVVEYEVLEVHRGQVDGKTIYVAHFNPRQARSAVESNTSGPVGGNVTSFHEGDIHRMALDLPLDDYLMDGLINKYLDETRDRSIYWALWTDQAR
jgi:hypothetical protein